MDAGEVIGSYLDLWQIEQSFRMSKTDLRARPMFHHKRQAIEAHLTIVFAALAVSREVQNRTALAIRNVIRQVRPLRSATVAINGAQQTLPPAIPTEKADDPRRPELTCNSGTKSIVRTQVWTKSSMSRARTWGPRPLDPRFYTGPGASNERDPLMAILALDPSRGPCAIRWSAT